MLIAMGRYALVMKHVIKSLQAVIVLYVSLALPYLKLCVLRATYVMSFWGVVIVASLVKMTVIVTRVKAVNLKGLTS